MKPDTPDDLKAALKALKGAYRETKTRTEQRVCRWQWATGRYVSLIPFEQERDQVARGKLLGSEPKAPKNVHAFGFDDQDRLVVICKFGPDGKAQMEEFTEYSGDKSLSRVYLAAGKRPGGVAEMIVAGGSPLEMRSLGSEGDYLRERYQYAAGRLESIDVEQFDALVKRTFTSRVEFAYDDKAGTGQAIHIDSAGKRTVQSTFAIEPGRAR
jgi:hypothetical protein